MRPEFAGLKPAFRLRAGVVRVEPLRTGLKGCRVLTGSRTYPVIGAVSASHTIVELGAERWVNPGEVATLAGADHPDMLPNTIAQRAGISVYDVLMHLSARLPVSSIQGHIP